MPLRSDQVMLDEKDTSPAVGAAAVTPADSDLTVFPCRGIYVGGAGNVAIVTPQGDTVTFVAVPAGSILPVRAKQIRSTNTTATNIVALY